MRNVFFVALENLRSLHNIGAIFRTCSFFGIENVILVGYTGVSFDHTGMPLLHPNIKKTALGSSRDLSISTFETSADLVKFTKDKKLNLVSVEQTSESIDMDLWTPKEGTILVFGNEVTGVSREVLKASDLVVHISRKGNHNSLNVATCCGIILKKVTS